MDRREFVKLTGLAGIAAALPAVAPGKEIRTDRKPAERIVTKSYDELRIQICMEDPSSVSKGDAINVTNDGLLEKWYVHDLEHTVSGMDSDIITELWLRRSPIT